MKKRILYALTQILLVVGCAVLVPAGAVIVLKLTGGQEPEMIGWVGVLLLILIFSPMSAALSAIVLGTGAILNPTRTIEQTVMAIVIGILHGCIFLFAAISLPFMLASAAAVSLITIVLTTIHLVRGKQNNQIHTTV